MEYTNKGKMNTLLVIILFCSLLLSTSAYAACTGSSPTWVATPDYASVNGCVTQATTGDTINVQSGSAIWGATLTITKHISLIGGYGGATTIKNGSVIMLPTIDNASIIQRLSGFTFDSRNSTWFVSIGDYGFNATLGKPIMNVRIDHCSFSGAGMDVSGVYGIWNGGGVYGVVDHCTFGSSTYGYKYAFWGQFNVDDNVYNHAPQMYWQPGSVQSMYYEDNVIYIMDRVIAHNWASRGVYRYNTIIPIVGSSIQGVFELHGHQGLNDSSAMPSTFGIEEYGNLILNASQVSQIFETRGGNSMVFYNTTIGGTPSAHAYGGNVSCPLIDPEKQMIHDTYVWDNRRDYTGAIGTYYLETPIASCGGLSNRPTAGRDIFVENLMTPVVTFGTLSARPSSCSTGQGYWATDQSTTNLTSYVGDINNYPSRQTISGTFYKCTAANTWTAFYTPYTYPHPLTTGESMLKPNPPYLR